MVAAAVRVAGAVGGGRLAVTIYGSSAGLFTAVAIALMVYGTINATAVAAGVWFKRKKCPALAVQPT